MRTLLLAFLFQAAMVATAQEYDPSIPTPESVLGYPLGARVTNHSGMERYVSALAQASPRVVEGTYGSDYENRELRFLIASSEENIGRLDDIKSVNTRLTDPRTLSVSDASSLIEKTPVTVWLNCSTDGNETAGLESALMMAYHLAAATDGETKRLLEGAVVVLTPLMNPSSHERWTSWSNSFAAGPAGNPDPLAMEHNPPWGILTNNNRYLVDLNRESIWATQKESAALRAFYYEWNPMVFIDLHGEYDNFVGPGYTEPLNPLYTQAQRQWFDRFGKAIDRKFTGFGWSYSAWETGSFYPGFWESMGALNGAIGFTYETIGGGSKGLRYRREDGSIITLKLAAEQHFQASLAVIEASVGAREELMEDFAAFWRGARAAREQAFLIEPGSDPARTDFLIEMLLANRVEIYKSKNELSLTNVHDYFGRQWNEHRFPAGVYIVPVAQPQARLVLTMLRKDFELPKVTLDAAMEFRRNQEKAGFYQPNIGATGYFFYDVTAWSMPLTFNVPAYWTEAPMVGDLARIDTVDREPPSRSPEAQYGYVFRGESNASMALLIDLLQQGVVTNVAYSDFSISGRDYPRGSVVIRKERNPDVDLEKVIGAARQRHGIRVDALDSNYSESGPSLGSDQFVFVKRPKIAILAGDPVSVRSFGNTWFILEQLYRLAFTAIYKEQLNENSLDEYNVLVLPDGDYDDHTFSETWIEALEGWIRRGGTLVCFNGASAWISNLGAALTSARTRAPVWPLEATEGVKPRRTAAIPGAILRTVPDEHHYLSLGYEGPTPVLVRSNLAFESDPSLATPFTFSSTARNLVLSGFAYGDSVERLAGTPYVVEERVGSGHVVLFLDDPNFRVYWYGLARLFLNSILLSPSF